MYLILVDLSRVVEGQFLLTLHTHMDSLADGRWHSVLGYAEVGPRILTVNALEIEHGSRHQRAWDTKCRRG